MRTRTMAEVAIMTAVLCVLCPLAVPIGPVPISLGTLAVFLCAYLLGPAKGLVAVLLYLLLGAAGLPVFSGFAGGIGKLLGPTGGYLIGYLPMVLIAGLFIARYYKKIPMQVLGMLLGLAVLYALGTLWLAYQAGMPFGAALSAGVLPFIPVDLAKLVAAVTLGRAVRTGLVRAGVLKPLAGA